MRIIKIPKGHGEFRTIYAPSRGEKRKYRAALPELMRIEREAARNLGVAHVAHGFIEGRSPVTCAREHIGMAVTLSIDLSNWFDSVQPDQISHGARLAGSRQNHYSPQSFLKLGEMLCIDGAPRQGLPTSPTAANLAAVEFDKLLLYHLGKIQNATTTYTRYADDLTISFRDAVPHFTIDGTIWMVQTVAHGFQWKIAEHKTRIQYASQGRREIVGISVGPSDIRPTRETRRRLRALEHAGTEPNRARGLSEWCKLRLPRAARRPTRIICLGDSPARIKPKLAEDATTLVLAAPGAPLATGRTIRLD